MKKTFLTLSFCIAVLAASAQKLEVANPEINIGSTGYEVPVTATFELKNRSNRHVTVTSVKTDCGCLQVNYPKKSIAGGETFRVSVTYDARLLGHFTKQAAVYLRGSDKPLWLTMKGVVRTDWVDHSKTYPYAFGSLLADANNIEFDDVNKGEHPEQVINIYNNGGSVMVPNMLHLPPYITALATPETLHPGQAGKMTLTLNSQKLNSFGLTQTTIYLAENLGEKVSSQIELPVSVVQLPDMKAFHGANRQFSPQLHLSADSLTLGMVHGRKVKRGVITLTNQGRQPLNISSLQMFTQGMTVMLGKRELQPGETTKMKVTIDRDVVLQARQRPRVLMITNDPDHAKVVIRVNVK